MCSKEFGPSQEPTQPSLPWVPTALFLGGKAARAWSWLFTSIGRCVGLCLHFLYAFLACLGQLCCYLTVVMFCVLYGIQYLESLWPRTSIFFGGILACRQTILVVEFCVSGCELCGCSVLWRAEFGTTVRLILCTDFVLRSLRQLFPNFCVWRNAWKSSVFSAERTQDRCFLLHHSKYKRPY
jgi:hypothetical protein